jgi:signal peptide peptidase SppA
MSKQLARAVLAGFNMQPALLAPSFAEMIVDELQTIASANARDENEYAKAQGTELVSAYGYSAPAMDKPFAYADGIAFIPVSGVLVNRFNHSWGYVTGYNFIRNQLNLALEDDDVKGIVFDINSGGGQVTGCFELAEDIYKSRSIKPSMAVVDAHCYSAAYAIASSASKVLVTPSGAAGSIGAVIMHMEYEAWLKEAGIKVSFIFSGDHKTDGNPYESLSAEVKAGFQVKVDSARSKFVDLVTRNRGLDTKAVFDTQADIFESEQALQLGLVDGITTPIDAVVSFLNELSGSELSKEGIDMSGKDTTTNQPSAESNTTVVAANTEVASAERQRISGILACDEAKDKQALANHLALDTDLSVDAAKAILVKAASEKVEASATVVNALETAMDKTVNPQVGADVGQVVETVAQRIIKAQEVATGRSTT